MTKRIVVGLAAVLALTAGTMFAQQDQTTGRKGRMGRGAAGGRMAHFLELTDAQKQQMRDIGEQARTQAQPYTQQLQAARAEIEKLVKAGTDADTVAKRAEELAAANAGAVQKLAGIHAWSRARMFSVLTPEQREKAQQLRDSFGPGFGGRGFGPMKFKDKAGKARTGASSL